MLLATLLFSLMNVAVKLLPHIPAVEIVFFRSVVSLFLSVGILKSRKISIWGHNHLLLIVRGVSGALALVLYFKMIQDIPLASATTILFLTPVFASILGIFFVKEQVKPIQWLFYLISFLGILLIKGFDARIGSLYLLLGFSSSLFSGIAFNCIRKLNTSEHPLVIIFYFPLVTLPISGVWTLFNWVKPEGWDWLILLTVGLLTQVAQYFMTRSFQSEEISKVASLRYLGIIYALVLGYIIFGEGFGWMVYLGMAITIFGVVLNIWYKHNLLKSDEAIFKGKLMN
ncbi:MAG: DMT family transporter [Cyclobacteriaceae bacterium]|nr:DMT family transporter [Cyclobacteriaceae bacterium]